MVAEILHNSDFPQTSRGQLNNYPASILHKFIAGRYWRVSYPDGTITARYRFIRNAYWVARDVKCLHVDNVDSNQTVRMRRLI